MDQAAPTNLVALRDRREQVIGQLTEQFAADVLDVEEFEARVERAHAATTVVALDRLVADLAPLPATTASAAATAIVVRDDPGRPARKAMTAVFSGFERSGPWIVPKQLRARLVFAGGLIDFREADFAPGVTELHVTCVMGGLQILVPPQLAVDCDLTAIMGGVDHRNASAVPDPGRAVLRISGTVVMGGLEIEMRLPGESRRDAKRRARRERRSRGELPRAAVARLPAGRPGKPDDE